MSSNICIEQNTADYVFVEIVRKKYLVVLYTRLTNVSNVTFLLIYLEYDEYSPFITYLYIESVKYTKICSSIWTSFSKLY